MTLEEKKRIRESHACSSACYHHCGKLKDGIKDFLHNSVRSTIYNAQYYWLLFGLILILEKWW